MKEGARTQSLYVGTHHSAACTVYVVGGFREVDVLVLVGGGGVGGDCAISTELHSTRVGGRSMGWSCGALQVHRRSIDGCTWKSPHALSV